MFASKRCAGAYGSWCATHANTHVTSSGSPSSCTPSRQVQQLRIGHHRSEDDEQQQRGADKRRTSRQGDAHRLMETTPRCDAVQTDLAVLAVALAGTPRNQREIGPRSSSGIMRT